MHSDNSVPNAPPPATAWPDISRPFAASVCHDWWPGPSSGHDSGKYAAGHFHLSGSPRAGSVSVVEKPCGATRSPAPTVSPNGTQSVPTVIIRESGRCHDPVKRYCDAFSVDPQCARQPERAPLNQIIRLCASSPLIRRPFIGGNRTRIRPGIPRMCRRLLPGRIAAERQATCGGSPGSKARRLI
jgi:hypothetical protein